MGFILDGKAAKKLRLPTVNYEHAPMQIIPAQAGDSNSRYFRVSLYDDLGDVDLSQYTSAALSVVLPNDEMEYTTGEIHADENFAIFVIPGSMLQIPGKVKCNVSFAGREGGETSGETMELISQTFYLLVSCSNAAFSTGEVVEGSNNSTAALELFLDKKLRGKRDLVETPPEGEATRLYAAFAPTGAEQAKQSYVECTPDSSASTVVLRDGDGQINLPNQETFAPTGNQAIGKEYADASYASQSQLITGLAEKYMTPLDKTSSEWASDTQIIVKGQLAINRLANGRVQLRVGTGTKKFTALKPVAEWNIVEDDLGFGTFETAMEVRVTSEELDTIEYYCPDSPENDFYAALTFSTGTTAPEFTPDERCKFTGTHCTNGKFTPKANMHYNVYYWYDGTIQAVVRGVPTDDAAYPSTGGATIGAIDNANPPALEKVVYCAESEIPENPSEGVEYACTDFIKKEDLDIDLQAEIDGKQAKLTFDTAPTASSTNPVTSAGIYNAIANFMTIQVSDSLIGG